MHTATLWTAVPDGAEDEIEGDFHTEIKLNILPVFVAYHKGLAYVTGGGFVISCDVADAIDGADMATARRRKRRSGKRSNSNGRVSNCFCTFTNRPIDSKVALTNVNITHKTVHGILSLT